MSMNDHIYMNDRWTVACLAEAEQQCQCYAGVHMFMPELLVSALARSGTKP